MLTQLVPDLPTSLPSVLDQAGSGLLPMRVAQLEQQMQALVEHHRTLIAAIRGAFDQLNRDGALRITDGTIDGTIIGGTAQAAGSFTDIDIPGTAHRLTADFSNATRANRFLFKDRTTNNGTNVGAVPNGTNNVAAYTVFGGSDPDNAHFITMATGATSTVISSTKSGTGTQRDLELQIGGVTKARIDASGNVVLAEAALATNATDGFTYIPSCAGTPTGTPTAKTGRIPLVYDSTNNKLYAYNGAWKSATFA